MSLFDWSLLLLLSVMWGGSFFFSKLALQELPPLTVVLARVSTAALALFIYLRIRRQAIPTDRVTWAAFLGMGLLNNLIPFTLLFWGQTQIASGLASILNATTPIFSILVAHFLTRDEGMTRNKLAGVALGFAGVAVLMAGDGIGARGLPLLPLFACLAAALTYGFAGVFGRRFRRMGIPPATVAFGQVTATTLMMIPIVALVDAAWQLPMPSMATVAALLALGLISTAFAYIIFFHILAVGGVVNSSLVTLLVPVSAILLGYLFLGERLAFSHLAGMGLIALGLLSIDGRLFRWLWHGRKAATDQR